jgi:hypothetical protein
MASGYDSAGNEILVAGGYIRQDSGEFDALVSCHEIKDGRVRWEIREHGSMPEIREDGLLPETNTNANVAIDSSGDVLVGWRTGISDSNGMLAKLSAKNGSTLWKWKPESERGHFLVPVSDKVGKVWVAWPDIKCTQYDWFHCINLTALNGQTGQAIWTRSIDMPDSRSWAGNARLQALENGDALLLISPPEGSSQFPWEIFRISGKDGAVVWQMQIQRLDEWSPATMGCVVDEASNRLVAAWHPLSIHEDLHVSAFNLSTGKLQWNIINPDGMKLKDGVELTRFTKRGDLELWAKNERIDDHINWRQWGRWYGIPVPLRSKEWEHGIIRLVLSGKDGAVKTREFIKSGRDWHGARLADAGPSTQELFVAFNHLGSPVGQEGCLIRMESNQSWLDARTWLPENDSPNSPKTAYRVIRSPSGITILARQSWKQYSPQETHRWEIHAR